MLIIKDTMSTLGVPGWNTATAVFIDQNAGSDANDGLSLSRPLKSLAEYARRLGSQVIDGAVTPLVTITISGDSADSFHFAPKMTNHAVIFLRGSRADIAGLSGTLSTFQAWNAATKSQCEFSFAGLASSWTAAGAVGHFLALPSLGSGNVTMIVGKDLGSKTALSCGPADLAFFEPVTGGPVAFQGYKVNKIAGQVLDFAPDGEGIVIVQDLELGDPSNLHNVRLSGTGQTTFLGCRLFGVDNYCLVLGAAFGCYVVGWRNNATDLLQCTVHDSVGGAFLGVHDTGFSTVLSNVLSFGSIRVDQGGSLNIEGDASTFGAAEGLVVLGRAELYASFWAKNAASAVLRVLGGASVTYADAAKIGATGSVPANLYAVSGAVSSTLPLVNTAGLSGIVTAL